MKVFSCLLLLHTCLCFDLPREGCYSDLKINDDHYNVTSSYEVGDSYPTDAHYDGFGNLFYVESGRNSNGFYYDVFMVRCNNSVPEKIPGLPDGLSFSIAVDRSELEMINVYFGTGRGIYKYNYESDGVSLVSESSLKLNMLFVDKDGNKYITENNDGIEELYLLDGERKIRFNTLEALNEMAIDDKNNIYYIKEESLYVLKSSLSSPVYIGNITYTGIAQISFHQEYVFIASDALSYFHVNDIGKMKMVDDAPENVTAIAFDHTGSFILGVRGKIMKYEKNECFFRNNEATKEEIN